jgi:hypothetical protein
MRRALWLSCTLSACASPPPTTRASQAVTNGAADAGDPAVIALVDSEDTIGCTASVIGPHTAITAAHCLAGRDPRGLRAMFGSSLADGTFVAIADARLHPAFDGTSFAHDVAMLTLREPSPVPPLALDMRTIDASLVDTTFTVVGFGTTAAASSDGGAKRVGTARISDVLPEELTAVPDPSQPCRGDSGGPALLSPDAVAAVVSRGDTACSDHAIYARIDVARAALVDPYLADTAPGAVHTGDACFYEGHCAEGPCLQTHDDPLLYFCSRACTHDSDCPDAMTCASDGCRYPEPSPGALGSPCAGDAECTSGTCRDELCTVSCFADPDVCPTDYACRGDGLSRYCVAVDDDGCGGCASGGGAPAWLVILGFICCARAGRSGRSASRRGSRAARSRGARRSRAGS